jgi:type IV secretion system protein VirB1
LVVLDFAQLAYQCAPQIHEDTLGRLVQAESSFNPYAIGVVGGHLQRQPKNQMEAIATAAWLERKGFNYSVGLAQINKSNFGKYGLTLESAFEPCLNLRTAASVLSDCYTRAYRVHPDVQEALRDSLSCYYSGNFKSGYKAGYVIKVVTGTRGHEHPPTVESAGEVALDKGQPPSALLF